MSNPNYDNIIFGSGIAGLTIFYYLAELTRTRNLLLTNNIVSQTNAKFPFGPRFLHKNRDTEALLRRLGFPTQTKEVFIGYKIGDEVRNYATEEFRQQYALRSRGTSKVEGSFLTGGKPNFTAYEISQVALGKSLLNRSLEIAKKSGKNNIVICNIENVTGKKVVTDKATYYGDNIISTIPLGSLFQIVSDTSVRFNLSRPASEIVHFFLTDEKGKDIFNYIYSVTDIWYRKTYVQEMDKWVYETHEDMKFEKEFSSKILDKVSLRTQVTKSMNLKELGNIKLVGRYSQMNHSIKTENIVHWAYNYTRKFNEKKKR